MAESTPSLPITGSESATSRQPTEFNYSQSNQFKVYLGLFPKTEWFVVRANIPSVTLGQGIQATRLIDMPIVANNFEEIQYSSSNCGAPYNFLIFHPL